METAAVTFIGTVGGAMAFIVGNAIAEAFVAATREEILRCEACVELLVRVLFTRYLDRIVAHARIKKHTKQSQVKYAASDASTAAAT